MIAAVLAAAVALVATHDTLTAIDGIRVGHHINGSAPAAIAVGYVLVNTSDAFVSSDKNKHKLSNDTVVVSHDPQPESWRKALATVRNLTVRGYATERGFDAIGLTMLHGVNDGSPYVIAPVPPSCPLAIPSTTSA